MGEDRPKFLGIPRRGAGAIEVTARKDNNILNMTTPLSYAPQNPTMPNNFRNPSIESADNLHQNN